MADTFNMGDLCQKKIHDYLIAKLLNKMCEFLEMSCNCVKRTENDNLFHVKSSLIAGREFFKGFLGVFFF
jgi:hypothetical protein